MKTSKWVFSLQLPCYLHCQMELSVAKKIYYPVWLFLNMPRREALIDQRYICKRLPNAARSVQDNKVQSSHHRHMKETNLFCLYSHKLTILYSYGVMLNWGGSGACSSTDPSSHVPQSAWGGLVHIISHQTPQNPVPPSPLNTHIIHQI